VNEKKTDEASKTDEKTDKKQIKTTNKTLGLNIKDICLYSKIMAKTDKYPNVLDIIGPIIRSILIDKFGN